MASKTDALAKMRAAEKQCNKVHAAWTNALEALEGGVSTNGYGIYHDRALPLRRKLQSAQNEIRVALETLDAIEWPNDQDYDAIE